MGQTTIPGTKQDWLVVRGWLNSMFTEIYTKLFETDKVLTDNNYDSASKSKLDALPTNSDLTTTLATKVDKVTGKGLSTNDYDNTAKSKVDALSIEKKGTVSASEEGVPVVFAEAFPAETNYELKITCYDASGNPVGWRFTNKTISGFTAISAEPATFVYETITL